MNAAGPLVPELPGFDDPLGVLRACHQRMLSQCAVLEKLPAHLAGKGVDDEARNAIDRILKYFSTSAVHHHQDEEQDLFPLLDDRPELAGVVQRLRKDHEQLERLWQQLLPELDEPASLADNPGFPDQVQDFCAACRAHIQCEENELLDVAQQMLSHDQLRDIGRSMQRRRRRL